MGGLLVDPPKPKEKQRGADHRYSNGDRSTTLIPVEDGVGMPKSAAHGRQRDENAVELEAERISPEPVTGKSQEHEVELLRVTGFPFQLSGARFELEVRTRRIIGLLGLSRYV